MSPDAGRDRLDDPSAVAIVGMACRVPGADSAAEFWTLLREGRDPVEEVPPEELTDGQADDPAYVPRRKPFADPALFDGDYFGMSPAECAATDPQQRFLLETAVRALEDAALDPARFTGDVGVYVGMNQSDYLMRHVLPEGSAVRRLGWHRVLMGNDRGFTATQLSYRLGLTGPSVAVDCACSSGLAAVHHACRALVDFDTDAALAGGVAINPVDVGYRYAEGGIAAPDGVCRPFSAHANGTVFGSGVAVVVLKRLEDAVADGDRVHAVILASAVNNDGARKSGYTAPSPAGQAELIGRVHRLADVDAGEIGYVEAHGTGTALGDPIEVAGLTEAFRGVAPGSCGLGSVKSNIGHLDSASGVAGLVKVVLALRHGWLPATLHAEEPNPHIDFANSPFRLTTEGAPWTSRRLAGVSSFGVGGTNVHVLVAAAHPAGQRAQATGAVAVPFTARTEAALDELERELAARLADADATLAADIAYTTTRAHLRHPLRRALLWRPGHATTTLSAGQGGRAAFRLASGGEAPDRERFPEAAAELRRLGEDPSALALAWAAVWAARGAEPVAVVSDRDTRLAAAVLAGVLPAASAPEVAAALRAGADLKAGLGQPARLPWYDESGDQLCAPGQVPDLAAVLTGAPPEPGRRTPPPKVDVVLNVVPVEPVPTKLFPGAATTAEDFGPALTAAWVAGVVPEPAPAPAGARVVDVPGHPFDRTRYWIDPPAPGTVVPAPDEPMAADPAEHARTLIADALGRTDLGDDDNVFAEGGDSLVALRVVARARESFGVPVRLGAFMADPTARTLARLIAEAGPVADETPEDTTGPLPLTPLQQRFHFLSQLPGAAEAYHVPVLADLRGPADLDALRAAVGDVVRRHESLRLAVLDTPDGPVQEVRDDPGPIPVPVLAPGSDEELQTIITGLLATPIPLDAPPPLLARIARMGPDRLVLIVVLHHLVADARSTGVFLEDLYACYERRTGTATAEPAPIAGRFTEFVRREHRWLDSAEARAQLDHWVDTLRDAPEALDLPTDRPRGAAQTYRGARRSFALPPGTGAALRRLAEQEATTPFAVLLAAFGVFLSRISGNREVVVGVPVSGRHKPGTDRLIGNFVNTLPLRLSVSGAEDFHTTVRNAVRAQLAALDNQDVPFELIARALRGGRDLATAPVCQVLFNMLDAASSRPPAPAGLTAEAVPFDMAGSPMDLQLDWWLTDDGEVGARLLYAEVFEEATVTAWQQILRTLVRELLSAPDQPLRDVPAEPPSARARNLRALAGPAAEVPARGVHALCHDVAARHPDRLAVTDGTTELTYGRLLDLAGGVATTLTARGVREGEPVAILMPRDTRLVVALLGVLRAGATPVPVDLNHPPKRIAMILADCAARLACVADAGTTAVSGLDKVVLSDLDDITPVPGPLPGDEAGPDVGAYLTYTSGTTGRPKGIHFPHRALTHLMHWETEGFGRPVRFLQLASFGFDAAFHETFAALCTGGSLHMATDEVKHDHDLLLRFVADHRVEKAILPVSLLHALAARPPADHAALRTLREIASTGEQLRIGQPLMTMFEALPDCTLINNYGPAETHVVTSYRFTGPPRDWPRWAPIGRPIPGVALRVVDADGVDVPRGTVGELVISGPCVATGYLGQDDLTAQRFGPDGPGGARAYRSGDRARLLRSGDLELLGRADQQVKIRGFRVEPGEIEVVVRQDPAVRDVAIVASDGTEGDRGLHAYLVVADGSDQAAVIAAVRERLRAELPAYMVPSTFTALAALPVNANGKVDTARLPAPRTAESAAPVADDSPEGRVLTLFRDVLHRPDLGADDGFFDAGGHSLLATTLIHRLRVEFGAPLSVDAFYRTSTPAAVARLLASGTGDAVAVELPPPVLPQPVPPGLAWLAEPPDRTHQKTFVHKVDAPVDAGRLRGAAAALARHQAALRLRLTKIPDADAALVLEDEPPRVMEPAAAELGDDPIRGLYERLQDDPVDLRGESPLRLAVVPLPDGHTLLGLTVHKVVLDGLGQQVLLDELARAYEQPDQLTTEDTGFLRYLGWRTGPGAPDARARAWSRTHGVPAPGVRHEPGPLARASWSAGCPLHAAVRQACADQRTTPFTWHLTAFALATAADEPVTCSVPMDGRPVPELAGTIGGFATVAPLRLDLATTPAATLAAVRGHAEELAVLRTAPLADATDLVADPRLVFSYQRAGEGGGRFAGAARTAVGPDTLDVGQAVRVTVYDSGENFLVSVATTDEDAERLLARYRQALYDLTFELDVPAPELEATR